MNLDELRDELRARGAKAEGALRVDVARLRARAVSDAGRATRRLEAWLWIELGVNAVAAAWLERFAAMHAGELRFVAAAAPLVVTAIAHVVFGASQLARLRRVDLAGSVAAIQRELETLRAGRIRMTKWTLLLAPLLWIPLLLVVLEGSFGVDGYAVLDRAWLIANVAFGAAFVPLAAWGSRLVVDRFGGSPLLRRIARDVSGRNLAAARALLDDIAGLEG